MVNSKIACELIRKMSGVTEKDHFGGDAFSANKRMFATLWHEHKKMNIRLSPEQQQRFLEADSEAFVQIDSAWGKQGWTGVQLQYIDRTLFVDAVQAAYEYSETKSTFNKKKTVTKAKPKAKVKKIGKKK